MKKLYYAHTLYVAVKSVLKCSPAIMTKASYLKLRSLTMSAFFLIAISFQTYADVNLTTATTTAGNINQGANSNIIYVAKIDVTVSGVSVNNISFKLNGTFDASDLATVSVYFNSASPTVGGSFLGSASAAFAAGHAYSIVINNNVAAGASGYYVITVNVNSDATDNNIVKINGATDPVVLGFTTAPTVTNNQSDLAGAQTIQASDVTLTTSALAAGNINQGTNSNIVYVTKIDAATEPVSVNKISFTLNGTFDATDLATVSIYFNPSSPTVGGSFLGSTSAAFASGHLYSIAINSNIAAGGSGYYVITVNVNSDATDNNTVKINGASDPVVLGFTTTPNITNNQADLAGTQTIQASDVTLTTSTLAAGNINQGTNSNIIYVTKIDAAIEPVSVNNISFKLNGTFDATDVATVAVYFNPSAPTVGGSFLGSTSAAFASGHLYSIAINNNIAAGGSGYYVITVNVNSDATDNNMVKINGATDPVVLGFTATPNINNNQADLAGTQTIQASDITLTTSTMAAGNINQGTNSNIVYVTKIDAATEPVSVNNISFKLNGTFDASDLATVAVYFNPSSPTVGGSFLGSASAAFASGHAYSIVINNNVAAGGSGYYIIVVNVNSDATDNNTVKINGATDPVVLGFTATPNIKNNQADLAGTQTIQAADITLSTSPITSNVFPTNSTSNVVYIARIAVATEPISVNNISFTLNGTFDASDLSAVQVYFNPSAPAVGGSFLGSTSAAFGSGHPYSIAINNNVAAGGSGYYVITVNVQSAATTGHTVLIDGSTDPVVLGYTTSPNITNNQTNNGGSHTLPLTFASIKAYENLSAVEVEWSVTNDGSIKTYFVERSGNGTTFNPIGNLSALFNGVTVSSYKLQDRRPLTGINFYRIRALHEDGKIEYSSIVKIHLNKGFEGISVYPNPIVKSGSFNLQLQNLPKGVYNLSLYNVHGQRIQQQQIDHIGGSSIQQISLKGIAGGVYSIELLSNGKKYVRTIIVE